MVNKQYNVQNLSKNKTNDVETLKQTITVIPNETASISNGSGGANDTYQSQQQNAFERNITQNFYYSLTDSLDGNFEEKQHSGGFGDDSMEDIVKNSNNITGATDADSQSQKHLSINDIGRFQYILQMDREMVRLFALSKFRFDISGIQHSIYVRERGRGREREWDKRKKLISFHYVIISGPINIMNNFAKRSFISLSDRYVARILSNLCADCVVCFLLSIHPSFLFVVVVVTWTIVVYHGRDRCLGRRRHDSFTSEFQSIRCINGLLIRRTSYDQSAQWLQFGDALCVLSVFWHLCCCSTLHVIFILLLLFSLPTWFVM